MLKSLLCALSSLSHVCEARRGRGSARHGQRQVSAVGHTVCHYVNYAATPAQMETLFAGTLDAAALVAGTLVPTFEGGALDGAA